MSAKFQLRWMQTSSQPGMFDGRGEITNRWNFTYYFVLFLLLAGTESSDPMQLDRSCILQYEHCSCCCCWSSNNWIRSIVFAASDSIFRHLFTWPSSQTGLGRQFSKRLFLHWERLGNFVSGDLYTKTIPPPAVRPPAPGGSAGRVKKRSPPPASRPY